METILQAVFTNEATARQGQQALVQLTATLADTDSLAIGETYLLHRNSDGEPATIQSAQGEAIGTHTLGGGLLGGLLGLLGGPVGVVAGAALGLLAGGTGDALKVHNTRDYLHEAAKALPPGQAMLVAHLWEASVGPVNTVLHQFQASFSRMNVDQELAIANQWEATNTDPAVSPQEQAWRERTAAHKAARRAGLDELKGEQPRQMNPRVAAHIAELQARLASLWAQKKCA